MDKLTASQAKRIKSLRSSAQARAYEFGNQAIDKEQPTAVRLSAERLSNTWAGEAMAFNQILTEGGHSDGWDM